MTFHKHISCDFIAFSKLFSCSSLNISIDITKVTPITSFDILLTPTCIGEGCKDIAESELFQCQNSGYNISRKFLCDTIPQCANIGLSTYEDESNECLPIDKMIFRSEDWAILAATTVFAAFGFFGGFYGILKCCRCRDRLKIGQIQSIFITFILISEPAFVAIAILSSSGMPILRDIFLGSAIGNLVGTVSLLIILKRER